MAAADEAVANYALRQRRVKQRIYVTAKALRHRKSAPLRDVDTYIRPEIAQIVANLPLATPSQKEEYRPARPAMLSVRF
jgi:hypothetical protein